MPDTSLPEVFVHTTWRYKPATSNIDGKHVTVKSLVDAAVLASRHAEMCGVQARHAFNVYTVALEKSQKLAAISDEAILNMSEDITRRTDKLQTCSDECVTHGTEAVDMA
jgi:hypothetical protein